VRRADLFPNQTISHRAFLIAKNRHRRAHRLEAEPFVEDFFAGICVQDDFLVASGQLLELGSDIPAEAAA
jgi:hypothetical protein